MIEAFVKKWAFGAVALIVLSACAGNPATSLPPLESPAITNYELGPGDLIRVVVFGNEETVPTEYKLDENGQISYPLADRIAAKGLTTGQLEDLLAKRLEHVLVDPRVNVEVLTARPVFVLGGVNKPGPYPFSRNMTVLSAIATAEGFTDGAFDNAFKITRLNKDGTKKDWRAEADDFVHPDDVIFVYERF